MSAYAWTRFLPRNSLADLDPFTCNGSLVDSDQVTELSFNTSVASGCYAYTYPMSFAAIDPEGLDDAYAC